jgi:lipoprotein-releasing system permease protein
MNSMTTRLADSPELTIAIRHIFYRRRQTALSLLATALAVSISIIFISLVTGQQQILTGLVEEKLPHVTVLPDTGQDFIHLYGRLEERLEAEPGIRTYAPSLSGTATLSRKDRTKNALLKGADTKRLDSIYGISGSMLHGSFATVDQAGNAAIGSTLSKDLDAKLGDRIRAEFPGSSATDLKIAGIFATGTPLDERAVFVSLETARRFRDEGDVIDAVEISLEDIGRAEKAAVLIGSWGYRAKSWQETNPEIVRAISVGGFWTRFSVLLFMLLAFFGVASIMNLLVSEKTREIGMLMAIGASRSTIRNIFLAESCILGAAGAAIGAALGLAGTAALGNVPFEIAAAGRVITTLPLIVDPWQVLFLIMGAVLLSVTAAAYPARRASGLDPVAALRR